MATFPALKPSTRTFTPGRHPHSEISTLSGLQTRVRASNVVLDQRLNLTFVALTEEQMLSIRSHYVGQQGRFLSFTIPDDLLSGAVSPTSFTPTAYSWIYASRPTVTDIGLQRYDVAVELTTVPPEGASVIGVDFTVSVSMVEGAAIGDANTAGFTLAVTASLEAGAVGGDVTFGALGADLTIAITLQAGAASGVVTDHFNLVMLVEDDLLNLGG